MVGQMKLGEILLAANLIKKEQLHQALKAHKKADIKLGQYLVREDMVDEADIVEAVADQLKLDIYRPERFAVDPELVEIIPFELANRHQAAPLEIEDRLLKVAMPDYSIRTVDALEQHSRIEVEAVICTERQLVQLHRSLYGTFSDMGDILEGIGDVRIDDGPDRADSSSG